jgi:GxxExxY protein
MLRTSTPLDANLENLIYRTIGCCIEVHRQLGPGPLETICQRAVALEFQAAGIGFERERAFPVMYRGQNLYVHRVDLIVDGRLLLELKAVDRLHPVHEAQVLSCLRVTKLRVALLVNFNVATLPQGIRRMVL